MAFEIGTLVALAMTLCVYSYVLYKDTPLFDFAVNTFLGLSVGNVAVIATKSIQGNVLSKISAGDYIYIIPTILGLLVFFRLSDKYKNLSRLSIAVMFGTGTGLGLARTWHSGVSRHLAGTISGVLASKDAFSLFNNLIVVIGIITVMLYFTFTEYYNKPLPSFVKRVGRIFIMISFGAQFGAVILSRMAALSGRILFIVRALGIG